MDAPSNHPIPQRLAFGPFVADGPARRLLESGRSVHLTPMAFALLVLLLQRAGSLVTKAELFATVWGGRPVSDSALGRTLRELRAALGDDADAPRYIETAHGLGLRFLAAVRPLGDGAGSPAVPAGTRPTPPAASQAPAPPLAGRETELAQLNRCFDLARHGQRQLVFVTGEAGVGKTALVQALVQRRLAEPDCVVAMGRCIEQYGSREPYLPLLECLDRLARTLGEDVVRDQLARDAPSWLQQLPWLKRERAAAAVAEPNPTRMPRELAQVLVALAQERCLILWIEDLHWSDPSTLDALALLAARADPARLLVLATVRDGAAARLGAELRGLMQRCRQQGYAELLALQPLSPQAVAQWLQQRMGDFDQRDELARLLHRRSDGNALFIGALLADLERRGELRLGAAGWALMASPAALEQAVPDTLRELIELQLAQLEPAQRRLLGAAAVAGEQFSCLPLAAALQQELPLVEEACGELAGAGRLLRPTPAHQWPDGSSSAGFAFTHALVWQVLHEQVPPGRLAERQRRMAECIEAGHRTQPDGVAAELAMRFEAAGLPGRALAHAQRAGLSAMARGAYAEAVESLRHGLRLLPALPAAEHGPRELELLTPLGAALMAVEGYAGAQVLECYQRTLALSRVLDRPAATERALRGLWNVALVRGDLAQAQRLAEELAAIAQASGRAALAYDAYAKLGQTCLHLGRLREARDHLERALALQVPEADPLPARERPRVLGYLSWALWYAGLADQARERGRQAIEAAEAAGAHSTAFACGFVAWLHLFCGEYERAEQLARQQGEISTEHGLRYWQAWSRFTVVLVRAAGRPSPQDGLSLQRAVDDFQLMSAEVGVPHFLDLLAEVFINMGQWEQALRALRQSHRLARRNGNRYQLPEMLRLRAACEAARGGAHRAGRARRLLLAACSRAERSGAPALALRAALALVQGGPMQSRSTGNHRPAAAADRQRLRRCLDACVEGADTADHRAARAWLLSQGNRKAST